MNIVRVFDSNVTKTPDKPFLIFDGHDHTYSQVQDGSRRAAGYLQSLGVQPGDRVALMCYNTPGFVYAMLGAWRLARRGPHQPQDADSGSCLRAGTREGVGVRLRR